MDILKVLAALGLAAVIVEGRVFRMWPFSFIKALVPGNNCWQCSRLLGRNCHIIYGVYVYREHPLIWVFGQLFGLSN